MRSSCVELAPLERAIGPGPAHQPEQLILVVLARADLGHQLLCQHVERLCGRRQRIELAATHGIEQRGALHQVVAAQRQQPTLRHAADRVIGATHALQERRDRAWRAELADQLDIADVDAELERCGGDQCPQLARLETLLGIEPLLLGEAAVMRGDVVLADALAQMPRHALDHAAGVGEDQRRAMLLDQCRRADRRCSPRPRSTSPPRAAHPAAAVPDRGRARGRVDDDAVASHALRRSGSAPLPRSASAWPTGRCAAAAGRRAAASRSSDSARCAPRLLGASAWISSTMTLRALDSIARPDSLVSSRYSDSGVVTRMCGGRLRMATRSACGVSPVRTCVRIGRRIQTLRRQLGGDAASGCSRLR